MTRSTWACTVTSSAVVGSSAISSVGLRAMAMAIMARWRMPPENWCGIVVDPPVRLRDADQPEQLDGPLAGPRPSRRLGSWARIISTICQPTR